MIILTMYYIINYGRNDSLILYTLICVALKECMKSGRP